jgi:hypothetical protein
MVIVAICLLQIIHNDRRRISLNSEENEIGFLNIFCNIRKIYSLNFPLKMSLLILEPGMWHTSVISATPEVEVGG